MQPIALPEHFDRIEFQTVPGHIVATGPAEHSTLVYLLRGTDFPGQLVGVVLVHPDGSPRATTTYLADGSHLPGGGDLDAALQRLANA